MSETIDIRIPDIGDFDEVEVIEVLVSPGDELDEEDSIITLESEKASMEIPSPQAGVVREVLVSVGDKVAEGTPVLKLEPAEAAGDESAAEKPARSEEQTAEQAATDAEPTPAAGKAAQPGSAGGKDKQTDDSQARPDSPAPEADQHAEVLVLGAGPGGYTAAFRAADLGKRVVLVERYPTLGGVCLNVGCIPSKALLHVAGTIGAVEVLREHGVDYGEPDIDPGKLHAWKDGVVRQLTDGLAQLASRRKVEVVQGKARFDSDRRIVLDTDEGSRTLSFDHAIIAAGSHAVHLPDLPQDERIMDSTDALRLQSVPERLLVVGGGIIGLELATVFDALGSTVTVVEQADSLMAGADPDLVRVLNKRIGSRYAGIHLKTTVTGIEAGDKGLEVSFEGEQPETTTFDRVLVAVGRRPNTEAIDAKQAGIETDDRGFIRVDRQQRTSVEHIFAIGDIVGEPQLAHKATHQGKVAAEVIAGEPAAFDPRAIPAVAYTDPEVAWMGLTEEQAKSEGIEINKARIPWSASGRALGMGRPEGMTKLIFDKEDGRLLGAGIVGQHAGDLIAETMLAMEMHAEAGDIGLTIHPHPTLSETVAFAAEMVDGTITDLYAPKTRKPKRD